MKKNTNVLKVIFIYLVDVEGNIFTKTVNEMSETVQVQGLFTPTGGKALFESEAHHLPAFCKENEIHFATEEKEYHFSSATMTDVEKCWTVNLLCWRQKEVEGKCLTQPRHLKINQHA